MLRQAAMVAATAILLPVLASCGSAQSGARSQASRGAAPSDLPWRYRGDEHRALRSCEELWSPPQASPRVTAPGQEVQIDLDDVTDDRITSNACPRLPIACWSVYQDRDSSSKRVRQAAEALSKACRDDRACGCWVWGEALLSRLDARQQVAGVELLLDACRAGAQPACDSLERRHGDCSRIATSAPSAECRELERRGLLLSPPLTLREVMGCWTVGHARFDAACIDERRLVLRTRGGAWEERRFLRWEARRRDRLTALGVADSDDWFVRSLTAWPRAVVEASDGAMGRGYRLDLDAGRDGPWLPLTRPSRRERERLQTELPPARAANAR